MIGHFWISIFFVYFVWYKASWECQGKLYIICFNSRGKRTMYKKQKKCWNYIMWFFKMAFLFLNFISSLFLVFFNDIKSYECSKLRSTLTIWVLKVNEQCITTMKKINVLNFKVWIKLVTKYNTFCPMSLGPLGLCH